MEIIAAAVGVTVAAWVGKKCLTPSIRMKRPKIGVPGAKIIYTDQKQKKKEAGVIYGKLLVSSQYDLQGKPDYIFQSRVTRNYIPVELKSTTLKEQDDMPHEGDLMQLAAYFLIIEDIYDKRPKEGRLIYSNKMFIVKNTRKLRKQVKTYLKQMRQMLKDGKQEVEPSYVKCRYCICRGTVCEHTD